MRYLLIVRNRFKTSMSRVDRQGKLLPDIDSVYDNYNNAVYKYNVLQDKCWPPAQNRDREEVSLHLTYGRKLKQSRHTSKALVIIFNFSSGWFFKENKNKNALSRLMLIFLT